MRIVSIGCVAIACALVAAVAGAQAQDRLRFADDAALKISVADGARMASKSVVVVNSGPAIGALEFAAVSDDVDAPAITVAASRSSAVPANGAARIGLSFTSTEALDGFDGHLVAATTGAAAERDLAIDAKNELPYSVNLIIFGSFLLAAAFAAVRAATLYAHLAYRLATPNWDFSKSWASTFTVVGALLGTILSSVILPTTPERFSKETLAGMNILFGVVILVAPFVFAASQSARRVTKDGSSELQAQGTVAGYLAASALTLTGVIGQLITVFFLLSEIETKGALPEEAVGAFAILLVVAGLLVGIHAWRTMGWTAQNATKPDEAKKDLREDRAPAPAYSPSLL